MSIKNVFRVLAVTIVGALFAFGVSQSSINLQSHDLPQDNLSTQAVNDCGTDTCNGVQIEQMRAHSNGLVYIQTSGTEQNLNCPALANIWVVLSPSHQNYREMFTILLSQQLSSLSGTTMTVDMELFLENSVCSVQWVQANK